MPTATAPTMIDDAQLALARSRAQLLFGNDAIELASWVKAAIAELFLAHGYMVTVGDADASLFSQHPRLPRIVLQEIQQLAVTVRLFKPSSTAYGLLRSPRLELRPRGGSESSSVDVWMLRQSDELEREAQVIEPRVRKDFAGLVGRAAELVSGLIANGIDPRVDSQSWGRSSRRYHAQFEFVPDRNMARWSAAQAAATAGALSGTLMLSVLSSRRSVAVSSVVIADMQRTVAQSDHAVCALTMKQLRTLGRRMLRAARVGLGFSPRPVSSKWQEPAPLDPTPGLGLPDGECSVLPGARVVMTQTMLRGNRPPRRTVGYQQLAVQTLPDVGGFVVTTCEFWRKHPVPAVMSGVFDHIHEAEAVLRDVRERLRDQAWVAADSAHSQDGMAIEADMLQVRYGRQREAVKAWAEQAIFQ